MILVEVENFQSIAKQTIEIEGFSVLVGKSNLGKSAIVRAVKAALTGAPAESFVRHGASCSRAKGAKSCKCYCSVRIVGPDLDLRWEKGDSVNRYECNGRPYSVVGRGTPEFLGPPFEPVELGGERVLLQVFDQFAPLFLLDRSGTAVADTLSDVAKLDQINEAVRFSERDRKEVGGTRKVRLQDVKELESSLGAYETLGSVAASAESAQAAFEGLEQLAAEQDRLGGYLEVLGRLQAAFRALAPLAEVTLPMIHGLDESRRGLAAAERYIRALEVEQGALAALERPARVEVPSIEGVLALARKHNTLADWGRSVAGLKTFFAMADAANKAGIPETGPAALHRLHIDLSRWQSRLTAAVQSLEQAGGELQGIERELALVDSDFAALGVCPTCAQPVRARTAHGEGAAACLE